MTAEMNGQAINELLIVLRAQAGDRTAFHTLVDSYQDRLMYYVRRLLHDADRANDVLQDVWLDVFRTVGRLRSPKAFRVWLYRLAHDRAVRQIRRETLESRHNEQASRIATDADSWNELELLENAELVHLALEKLSVVHREVMVLRFLEEMNVKEISEVQNCSEGTAKSRLHYAKCALRKIISELDHV